MGPTAAAVECFFINTGQSADPFLQVGRIPAKQSLGRIYIIIYHIYGIQPYIWYTAIYMVSGRIHGCTSCHIYGYGHITKNPDMVDLCAPVESKIRIKLLATFFTFQPFYEAQLYTYLQGWA